MPVDEPQSLLPLSPVVFQILMVLIEKDGHGYSIVKTIEERSGDRVEPGNLYRTLRNMLQKGLIEECQQRPDPELDDQRRRYFQISSFGMQVARAETARLERLLAEARTHRLLVQRS